MKTRFGGLSQSVVYFKNCWYRIHDMLCSYPVSTPLAFLFGVFSHITSLTPLPLSEAKPSRHWRTDTHPESAQSGLLGRDSGGSAVRKQTSARSFHLAGVSGLPSLSWALPSISGADCCVWAHTGGSGGALWDSPRVTRHCFWWCAPTPDSLVVRELGATYCCTLSLWQVPVTSLAAFPGAWVPPVQYGSGRAGDSDALAARAWVTCPLLESNLGKSKENTRIASEGEEK